jgi:hypothetical protein
MFFKNDGKAGQDYINTRDDAIFSSDKHFIEERLWPTYKPYADIHFKSDAKLHFRERFWEMYLGVTLIERGYSLCNPSPNGPEFFINLGSRKVWFEAVTPGRGERNDSVPMSQPGEVTAVPQREILLRLTQAVSAKNKRSDIIEDNDLYIVSINGSNVCPLLYGDTIPFILKALYPAGDLTIELDKVTGDINDSYYKYCDNIIKINKSIVKTDAFVSNEYCGISAVIYSYADPWQGKDESNLGSEFITIHNLKADNPLPRGYFSFGYEYWVEEQEEEIHLHLKDWNTENG